MEFMELENKRELLDFWMSAISYKQNLLEKKNGIDPEEAQTDALIIYDKYFFKCCFYKFLNRLNNIIIII